MQFENGNGTFQIRNAERYYQAMISIEVQSSEERSQNISKYYSWVELQSTGEENILREKVSMVSWKRNE